MRVRWWSIYFLALIGLQCWASEPKEVNELDHLSFPQPTILQLQVSPQKSNDDAPANLANHLQHILDLASQVAKLESYIEQHGNSHSTYKADIKAAEKALDILKVELATQKQTLLMLERMQADQLESFDQRISDGIEFWGILLGLVGLILPALSVYNGVIKSREAIDKSKEEARNIAENQTKKWIIENKESILRDAGEHTNEIKEKIVEIKANFEDSIKELESEFNRFLNKIKKDVEERASNESMNIEPASSLLETELPVGNEHSKAKQLLSRAGEDTNNGRYKKALEVIGKSIKALNEQERNSSLHAFILLFKAILHNKMEAYSDELDTYKLITELFEECSELETKIIFVKSLICKASVFAQLMRPYDEIKTYRQVIERFKDFGDDTIQELVSKAMFNLGVCLLKVDDLTEALNVYELLIQKFESSNNPLIKARTIKSIFNHAVIEVKLGQHEVAIKNLEAFIATYKGEGSSEVLIQIAKSILFIAATYANKGNSEIALSYFDKFIDEYENSKIQEIQNLILDALANSTEIALLVESKEKVLSRIQKVESLPMDKQTTAVIMFIRYLIDESSITDVMSSIEDIPESEEITWQFEEIRSYLDKFDGEKQKHIQAVVSYFEVHKDINKLRRLLEDNY